MMKPQLSLWTVKSWGLTLLEVIMALLILSGGLAALVTTWGGSASRMKKAQTIYEMTILLEKKLNEIEFEYRGKSVRSIPEEDSGDFGDSYPHYKWSLSSKMMEFPDLTPFLAPADGGVTPIFQTMAQQIQQILNQSVKEVTVKVTFTGGKKELTYGVTTLFVDTQTLQPANPTMGLNPADSRFPQPSPTGTANPPIGSPNPIIPGRLPMAPGGTLPGGQQ